MKTDLKKAKELLESDDFTCVFCKENQILTSTERGIKPLMNWVNQGNTFHDFSAADRIVGKAAAFLYVLLSVDEVYATVMSEAAEAVLNQYDIKCSYAQSVKVICNRSNTGMCPMEQAVLTIDNPQQAFEALEKRLAELSR